MHKTTIILFAILSLGFLLRFSHLDYPLLNGEAMRDYLVGKHIIEYQEIPLTGPCCLWNGAFGPIRNSPLYYYLIAGILALNKNILFLQFVNILLQILNIFFVYLLAKNLFGKTTALISSSLFVVSSEILKHSLFIWQPHLMEPFFTFSLLLLALSFLKSRFWLLPTSIFFFFLAAAIHNPPFAILPTYILTVFLILKAQKKSLNYFALTGFAAVLSFSLFYLPFFIHVRNQEDLFFTFNRFLLLPQEVLPQLSQSIQILLNAFSLSFMAFLLLTISLVFVLRKREYKQKLYLLVLGLAIVQFLIASSFFRAAVWSYYFTPIFGLFAIAIAEIVNASLSGKKHVFFTMSKIIVVLLLLKLVTSNFQSLMFGKPFEHLKAVEDASVWIKQEVLFIQQQENLREPTFFSIQVFANGIESPPTADLIFWAKLEEVFGKKFLRVGDRKNSYELLNRNDYIFLVCQSYPLPIEERVCLRRFSQEYRNYQLIGKIYDQYPFLVILAKKKS